MQTTAVRDKLKTVWDRGMGLCTRYLGRYVKEPARLRKKDLAKFGRGVLRGVGQTAVSFLFACVRIRPGVFPCGLGLLGAAERDIPYILFGLILQNAIFGKDLPVSLLTYAAVILLRLTVGRIFREKAFTEPVSLRVGITAIGAFILGFYRLIAGRFAVRYLWDCLLFLSFSAGSAFLYACRFCGEREEGPWERLSRPGQIAILVSLTAGVQGFIGFGVTAGLLFTLCAAWQGGALGGCAMGALCGLACGGLACPALAIAGMGAGSLRRHGTLLPMLGAVGCGALVFLVGGGSGRIFAALPQLLWGAAGFAPLSKLGIMPKIASGFSFLPAATDRGQEENLRRRRRIETETGLSDLRDALTTLSGVFGVLSARALKPAREETRMLCESFLKKHCVSCGRAAVCYGREKDTLAEVLDGMTDDLLRQGAVDTLGLPAGFSGSCPELMRTVAEIHVAYCRRLSALEREDKMSIFSLDYAAMANLLSKEREREEKETEPRIGLSGLAARTAEKLGMGTPLIGVYGDRELTVLAEGIPVSAIRYTGEELRQAFSRVVERELTPPSFRLRGDTADMTMQAAEILACKTGTAAGRKQGERVNGDNIALFKGKRGYYYALISDGMGSGVEAAVTSKVACIFLEKLLTAGNPLSTVMGMLNDFVRSRAGECFTTVDLLEVDLLTGQSCLVKGGAAPSYILREDKLYKMGSASLPVGITKELGAEKIKFALRAGDRVVMVSDGVAPSLEEGVWLAELLSHVPAGEDAVTLAHRITDTAAERNERRDDMTVLVVDVVSASVGRQE